MILSVVIPCFNREASIRDAVKSVLSQSEVNISIEVIVVDDGSTDKSLEMISDLDIKILSTGGRKGACAARNIGIASAKGNWIAFNDSDDFWRADKVEKIFSQFANKINDVEYIVHSFARGVNSHFTIYGNLNGGCQYLEKAPTLSKLLKKNFVSTQCLLVRKDALISIGLFDENLPRFQDWEVAIRLAEKYRGYYIDDMLSICIESHGSISTGFDKGIFSREYILEKHYSNYKANFVAMIKFRFDLLIRKLVLFLRQGSKVK